MRQHAAHAPGTVQNASECATFLTAMTAHSIHVEFYMTKLSFLSVLFFIKP